MVRIHLCCRNRIRVREVVQWKNSRIREGIHHLLEVLLVRVIMMNRRMLQLDIDGRRIGKVRKIIRIIELEGRGEFPHPSHI